MDILSARNFLQAFWSLLLRWYDLLVSILTTFDRAV